MSGRPAYSPALGPIPNQIRNSQTIGLCYRISRAVIPNYADDVVLHRSVWATILRLVCDVEWNHSITRIHHSTILWS